MAFSLCSPLPCTVYSDIKVRKRCLIAKAHTVATDAERASDLKQQQQQQAFLGLRDRTSVCLADIKELKPGYKGLVASSDIQAGDTVLELLRCNSLCIPIDSATVSGWKGSWLEPFQVNHGGMPGALLNFLSGRISAALFMSHKQLAISL